MNHDQLINKSFHLLQRNKSLKNSNKFILDELGNRINLSLENINLSLKNCLEIGFGSKKIHKYLLSRFNKINYYTIDISDKLQNINFPNNKLITMDHDKWGMQNKQFDLIVSNFYLHFTNNFDLLIENIFKSLNNNGFFIASLPGFNCFHELRSSMLEADIKIYGGAYRRFMEIKSVEKITQLLNKHNYKIPVLEIDTIELRYDNFLSMLNDIRYLSNSNSYYDRKKKFEKKEYFKKVEEIYWQKYANNNKLILQLEVIFVTSWKILS